jgi:hypothetical protein
VPARSRWRSEQRLTPAHAHPRPSRTGFASPRSRLFLPLWLLIPLAAAAELLGWLTGRTPKLNRFNVKVLTMNRWFLIGAAERDLGFRVSARAQARGRVRARAGARGRAPHH